MDERKDDVPKNLNSEQLKNFNNIKMISKEQFDEMYKKYSNPSPYHNAKDFCAAYTPSFFYHHTFPDSATDALRDSINHISNINNQIMSDRQKFTLMATTLKNFISENKNSELCGFCRYLINNSGTLARNSTILENELGTKSEEKTQNKI